MVNTYVALNYMKFNAPEWYAAVIAAIFFFFIFIIFFNVIQFELYNRTEQCHPYFYQSSACRKLIANTIANDDYFHKIKSEYSRNVYNDQASMIQKINAVDAPLAKQSSSIIKTILSGLNGTLGGTLGNASAPASAIYELKTLLDKTIVDPTLAKYVSPLQKLYNSLTTSSSSSQSSPSPS